MWARNRLVLMMIVGAIPSFFPFSPAIALDPQEIASQAAKFVVKIDGSGGGTGFIVRKNGNRYTVLTNEHVVRSVASYTIVTTDNRIYRIDSNQIQKFSGVDLVEVQFTSTDNYSVAELSNSSTNSLGGKVYTYGFNSITKGLPERIPQFLQGTIAGNLPNGYNGYTLTFNLTAIRGLSGSPLLDENGKVIGIYGLADHQGGITLGIPINAYARHTSTSSIKPTTSSPSSRNTKLPKNTRSNKMVFNTFSQLMSWNFDSTQNRLYFKTNAGVQPAAVLLFNPTRLVIDLPNIGFSRQLVTEKLTGDYESLTIEQYENTTTRLSLEVKSGFTINPRQVKFTGENPIDWYVSLPDPELR